MIQGIGIDIVSIKRFNHWHQFSRRSLKKIFSEQEISYCLADPAVSAQRFAARFAAREALYKALSPLLLARTVSFFELARSVCISGKPPQIAIVRNHQLFDQLTLHLSLSHEGGQAVAMVVIERDANQIS